MKTAAQVFKRHIIISNRDSTKVSQTSMPSFTFIVTVAAVLFAASSSNSASPPTFEILHHGNKTYAYREAFTVDIESVRTFCSAVGGILPSVHSAADVDFLHSIATRCSDRGYLFLGAKAVGPNWEWDDGTPNDYVNVSTDVCTSVYRGEHECGLAVVARVGRPYDKQIGTPWLPYALTGVKVCQLRVDPDPTLVSVPQNCSSGDHS